MFRSLILPCCALVAACSASTQDASDPSPDGQLLTDTIVTVNADGTVEQSTQTITVAERKAEIELRLKPRTSLHAQPSVDTDGSSRAIPGKAPLMLNSRRFGCSGADLWIYDHVPTDLGYANRLCIYSSRALGPDNYDGLNLNDVNLSCLAIDISGACSAWSKWAGNVRTIWPGMNWGLLYRAAPWVVLDPSGGFPAWGPLQGVNPDTSNYVQLWGA